MPEDPRPRHEYARPDTHSDFSVTETDKEADEATGGEADEPSVPEEVDASLAGARGEVTESETTGRPLDQEQADPESPGADNPPEDADEDFEAMTKDELLAHLEEHGQNVSSRTTKDELVKLAKEG